MTTEYTWAMDSLDVTLGVVGGLQGLLFSVITALLAKYQTFKFDHTLI